MGYLSIAAELPCVAAEPVDGVGDPVEFEVRPGERLGGAGDLGQFGLEGLELEVGEGVGLGDEEVVDGAGLEVVLGVALEMQGGLLEVLERQVGVAHWPRLPNSLFNKYKASVQLQPLLDLVGQHQTVPRQLLELAVALLEVLEVLHLQLPHLVVLLELGQVEVHR